MDLDPRDTQSLARLRVVGAVVLCIGVIAFFYGLNLKLAVPEIASGDFLEGRVSIDQVGRRNDAEFRAIATMMTGAFVAFVGLAFALRSSRRMMRLNAVGVEYTAEAVGRGLRRGLADDDPPRLGDVQARLAKLEDLRAQGLVNDDEYAAKRSEIIASL